MTSLRINAFLPPTYHTTTERGRWVAHEALTVIGLAATEPAASALLDEGIRRCRLLLLPNKEAIKKSGDVEGSAGVTADGWHFDDDDDDDDDFGGLSARTAAAAEPRFSTGSSGGVGGGGESSGGGDRGSVRAGAVNPNLKTGNGNDGGSDDDDQGRETVLPLFARLECLRYLLETFLAAEGAQGRRFDVARLRKFLALPAAPEGSEGE